MSTLTVDGLGNLSSSLFIQRSASANQINTQAINNNLSSRQKKVKSSNAIWGRTPQSSLHLGFVHNVWHYINVFWLINWLTNKVIVKYMHSQKQEAQLSLG